MPLREDPHSSQRKEPCCFSLRKQMKKEEQEKGDEDE
jgi:hypothetical protein